MDSTDPNKDGDSWSTGGPAIEVGNSNLFDDQQGDPSNALGASDSTARRVDEADRLKKDRNPKKHNDDERFCLAKLFKISK